MAKAITEFMENHIEKSFEKEIDRLATKEDLLKLDVKISDSKAEIIKWMFIFWIGQVVVTLAIIYFRR